MELNKELRQALQLVALLYASRTGPSSTRVSHQHRWSITRVEPVYPTSCRYQSKSGCRERMQGKTRYDNAWENLVWQCMGKLGMGMHVHGLLGGYLNGDG
jgi:hypothetical protein